MYWQQKWWVVYKQTHMGFNPPTPHLPPAHSWCTCGPQIHVSFDTDGIEDME